MKKNEALSWKKIIPFIWKFFDQKALFFIFLTILLIVQLYQFVPAIIVGKIVDFFTSYTPGTSLDLIVFFVVFLGVANMITAFTRLSTRKLMRKIFVDVNYNIKVRGFEKLVDFSMKWHDRENTGNKIERLTSGANYIKRLGVQFSTGGPGIITLGTIIFYTIIAFIFIDISLAIVTILFIITFFYIHFVFVKRVEAAIEGKNKVGEKASGKFYEGLSNVLTIKSLGAKDSFKSKIYQGEDLTKQFDLKILELSITKRQFFHVAISIATSVFVGLLVWKVANAQITIGNLLVYWTYFGRFIDSTWEATEIVDELQEIQIGVSRMLPIFETELDNERGRLAFPGKFENLELSNANFSYKEENADFYLKNINLNLKKGGKIGIAGRSGSGKSTIVKLLLGLYPLSSGSYQINNHNFYDIAPDETNKHISIVLQESELFNYSLKENITLLKEFDEELFLKSIRIAQLENLLEKLPEGAETLIGEKGYRVSGGERQRIGIARAIYKNSDILIMDEATSNLDSKTESRVQESLEKELSDKAIVIIAHRVSTLKNADKIIVMEKGTIIEEGGFNELLNKGNGQFAELFKIQSNSSQKN